MSCNQTNEQMIISGELRKGFLSSDSDCFRKQKQKDSDLSLLLFPGLFPLQLCDHGSYSWATTATAHCHPAPKFFFSSHLLPDRAVSGSYELISRVIRDSNWAPNWGLFVFFFFRKKKRNGSWGQWNDEVKLPWGLRDADMATGMWRLLRWESKLALYCTLYSTLLLLVVEVLPQQSRSWDLWWLVIVFFFQKTLFYSTVHVMAVLHITLFSYCRNCNEQSNFFSQLGMIYLLITGNETLVYGGSTSGVLVKLWVHDFNHQC